jgi:hypothetical protein
VGATTPSVSAAVRRANIFFMVGILFGCLIDAAVIAGCGFMDAGRFALFDQFTDFFLPARCMSPLDHSSGAAAPHVLLFHHQSIPLP